MELDAPTNRYSYAKHYTPPKYSVSIAKFIMNHGDRLPSRLSVMDPACGNMDLLRGFNMVFGERQLKIMGIDIFPERDLPYPVVKGNAFELSTKFFDKIDLIISNPPFGRKGHPSLDMRTQVAMDDYFSELLAEIKLEKRHRMQVTLELAFLGLITQLLKENGTCAIVLPESVFTCASYQEFRENFEKRYMVFGVLQLPVSAFSGSNASASTAVLFFKNRRSKKKDYSFPVQNEHGEKIEVNSGKGNWFPFKNIDFMSPPPGQENLPWKSLGTLFPHLVIKSGFKGKQPLATFNPPKKNNVAKYISSKYISDGKILVDEAPFVEIEPNLERTIVKSGDLLLVRSGSGCLGKIAIVGSEDYPLIPRSEIYVLSGFKNNDERKIVFQSIMIASLGQTLPWWAKILGRGVGTPNLNKEEILKIPILDMDIDQILKTKEQLKKVLKAA